MILQVQQLESCWCRPKSLSCLNWPQTFECYCVIERFCENYPPMLHKVLDISLGFGTWSKERKQDCVVLTCLPALLQVAGWGCSQMLTCASHVPGRAHLHPPASSGSLLHQHQFRAIKFGPGELLIPFNSRRLVMVSSYLLLGSLGIYQAPPLFWQLQGKPSVHWRNTPTQHSCCHDFPVQTQKKRGVHQNWNQIKK